jgi:hypothetical protein
VEHREYERMYTEYEEGGDMSGGTGYDPPYEILNQRKQQVIG